MNPDHPATGVRVVGEHIHSLNENALRGRGGPGRVATRKHRGRGRGKLVLRAPPLPHEYAVWLQYGDLRDEATVRVGTNVAALRHVVRSHFEIQRSTPFITICLPSGEALDPDCILTRTMLRQCTASSPMQVSALKWGPDDDYCTCRCSCCKKRGCGTSRRKTKAFAVLDMKSLQCAIEREHASDDEDGDSVLSDGEGGGNSEEHEEERSDGDGVQASSVRLAAAGAPNCETTEKNANDIPERRQSGVQLDGVEHHGVRSGEDEYGEDEYGEHNREGGCAQDCYELVEEEASGVREECEEEEYESGEEDSRQYEGGGAYGERCQGEQEDHQDEEADGNAFAEGDEGIGEAEIKARGEEDAGEVRRTRGRNVAMFETDIDLMELRRWTRRMHKQEAERVSASESSEEAQARVFDKMREKRAHIAKELLQTEQSYVDSLGLLISVFMTPMEVWAARIEVTPLEIKQIFGNIKVILACNKQLLEDMRSRIEAWSDESAIGDVFLQFVEYLRLYIHYVKNYSVACATLRTLKQRQSFLSFLSEAEQDPKLGKHTIKDLIIMPVQRIPRYIMLMRDLFANTLEEHPDYVALQEAHGKLCALAEEVEDAQNKESNMQQMTELQGLLREGTPKNEMNDVQLLKPGRKLVMQSDMICQRGRGTGKIRTVFMFSDLLLIAKCKRKKEQGSNQVAAYRFIQQIPMYRISSVRPLTAKRDCESAMIQGIGLTISGGVGSLQLLSKEAEVVVDFLRELLRYFTESDETQLAALKDRAHQQVRVHDALPPPDRPSSQRKQRSISKKKSLMKRSGSSPSLSTSLLSKRFSDGRKESVRQQDTPHPSRQGDVPEKEEASVQALPASFQRARPSLARVSSDRFFGERVRESDDALSREGGPEQHDGATHGATQTPSGNESPVQAVRFEPRRPSHPSMKLEPYLVRDVSRGFACDDETEEATVEEFDVDEGDQSVFEEGVDDEALERVPVMELSPPEPERVSNTSVRPQHVDDPTIRIAGSLQLEPSSEDVPQGGGGGEPSGAHGSTWSHSPRVKKMQRRKEWLSRGALSGDGVVRGRDGSDTRDAAAAARSGEGNTVAEDEAVALPVDATGGGAEASIEESIITDE